MCEKKFFLKAKILNRGQLTFNDNETTYFLAI